MPSDLTMSYASSEPPTPKKIKFAMEVAPSSSHVDRESGFRRALTSAKGANGHFTSKHCKLTRLMKRRLAVLALVLVVIGCCVLAYAGSVYAVISRSTHCTCSIRGFMAVTMRGADGAPSSCENTPGFEIKLRCPENLQATSVANYTIQSNTGPFSCCPPPTASTCDFVDPASGRFCDDLGKKRADCPSAPWKCYIEDLKDKLAKPPGIIRPDDLIIGDKREAFVISLCVGLTLFLIGLIIIACLGRGAYLQLRQKYVWLKSDSVKINEAFEAAPTDKEKARIVRSLPPAKRTREMTNFLRTRAAVALQRAFRGKAARRRFEEMILTLVKEGDPRGRRLRGMFLESSDADARDRYSSQLRALATKYERQGAAGKRLGLEGFAKSGPPAKSLLYDTGSSNDFRRLVKVRAISLPDDDTERFEVALTHVGTELLQVLRVTAPEAGSRLVVAKRPPALYTDVYGIKRGCSVMRVGELEWPSATGGELLKALSMRSRPIFLVIETGTVNEEGDSRTPGSRKLKERSPLNYRPRHPPNPWMCPPSPTAASCSPLCDGKCEVCRSPTYRFQLPGIMPAAGAVDCAVACRPGGSSASRTSTRSPSIGSSACRSPTDSWGVTLCPDRRSCPTSPASSWETSPVARQSRGTPLAQRSQETTPVARQSRRMQDYDPEAPG